MHPGRWANSKATHGLPPRRRAAREQVQIARLRKLAQEAKLDPHDFAEQFLAFIVKEVIRHHEAIRAAR